MLVASRYDAAAFAELYERHAVAMVTFFHRRTGCVETAADLMAETFAGAFTTRGRFRDTGVPGRAWLFAIARRQLTHFVRRRKVADRARRKLGVEPLDLTALDFERVEAAAEMGDLRSKLREALASLPQNQADAVVLRVVEQRECNDIAQLLDCSEGAARVRVSRGLTELADTLETT